MINEKEKQQRRWNRKIKTNLTVFFGKLHTILII